MPEIPINQNTGVIMLPPTPRDWIAGEVSGIAFEARLPKADWKEYLPTTEPQSVPTFDTKACVSFSFNNSLETQLNFLLVTGRVSATDAKWLEDNGYLDKYAKVNLSDRWLAKKSGTTQDGNYLVVVAETTRKLGAVPEGKWPWGAEITTWDQYYQEPPAELDALAMEFKSRFAVAYEWVLNPTMIAEQLKQAPLQIATPVCPTWNTGTVTPCGSVATQHATLLFKEGFQSRGIFDHYPPFEKTLAGDYPLPAILKIVIDPIKPNTMTPEATKYLKEHDKQFVLAVPSGRNAYIKNVEAQEIVSTDRAALAAIAYIREHGGGGGVPDALYDQFPKRPF